MLGKSGCTSCGGALRFVFLTLVLLPQLRLSSRGAKLTTVNSQRGAEAGGLGSGLWSGHSAVVPVELGGSELPVRLY